VSFAPLLDSPSAVGDEGRPRATSLAVVSAVLAALVTAVGYRVGQPDLLLSLGPFAGLAAAGLALLDRRRFVHRFFGHALLTWFGMPLAGLVVLSPFLGPVPVTVAGLAVALFGLAATWSDTGDRKSLRRGLYATGRVTIATWLWLVVGLLVGGVAVFLVVVPTSGNPGPSSAVVVFCGVLVVAAVGALVGLRWLPLRQLAARPHRRRVAATARRLQLATGVVAAVALLVGVAAVVAPADGWVPDAATVLASRVTVGAVVGLAGATFLGGALARGARVVANRGDPATRDRLAAAFAAIPLSICGAFPALLLAGYSFSFMAFIGFTSLVGIVVNNSIILVDYANQLVAREGQSVRAAVLASGVTRFTPILLTTFTTIGGLLPLALTQSDLWTPLSLVIIGGLAVSTLLTLFVVPVLYDLLTGEGPRERSRA